MPVRQWDKQVMPAKSQTRLTFVLGGARSGKSVFAEKIVTEFAPPWHYIATAHGYDDEMTARISTHKARRSEGWVTHEAPLELARVLGVMQAGQPVLVDCLTLWLTNTMLAGRPVETAIGTLMDVLAALPGPCVVVSNEVGLGIVPDNALARAFKDHAGRLHQRVAAMADRVVFMVAGLPMEVK